MLLLILLVIKLKCPLFNKKYTEFTEYYLIERIFDRGIYRLAYREQWGDSPFRESTEEEEKNNAVGIAEYC